MVLVGPIKNGQYEWAIVSDNRNATLFVLARNVDTFRSEYNKDVSKMLKKLRFYDPIPTYQSTDCVYGNNSPTAPPITA